MKSCVIESSSSIPQQSLSSFSQDLNFTRDRKLEIWKSVFSLKFIERFYIEKGERERKGSF